MKMKRVLLGLFIGCCWLDLAWAAGFNIPVKSISDQGNQFAGGAALASDATTNYYNPAGNTRINHPELVLGLAYIFSPAQFEGTANAPSPLPNGYPPFIPPVPSYTATGRADTYQRGLLPLLHFVSPLFTDRLFFGFSITSPSGLATKYDGDSILRYANLKASAIFINLGPSLSFKITDKLSIGAGPDFQRFNAEFKNHGYGLSLLTLQQADAESIIKANSWGYGWHAGIMYEFTPTTRIGFSYISRVIHNAEGHSRFSVPGMNDLATPNVKLRLVLPPSSRLSIYHEFNNQWAAMSTIGYTQWSELKNIDINNVAAISRSLEPQPKNISRPEYFHNTWSFDAAVNYKVTERFMLRLGAGIDGSATNNNYRDVIMPDAPYIATTIGFHFQQTKAIGWDAGYSHTFQKTATIRHIATPAEENTTETGVFRRKGNALGIQLVLNLEELFKRRNKAVL